MLYEYYCEACDKVFDLSFKMGEAPKTAACECGKQAERHFGNVGFILKGGGWPSKSARVNAQQTAANARAGRKQRGSHKSMKSTAIDYGNGDIRET